ncbi:MAG: DUF2723 domain-containing protein [Bacteroidales bacterium]|nr:DUF2723 domain-containing protein [Bacteroidales bacterium]
MKKYHLVNNIIGWVIGIVACAVYLLTAEPTASWWDCGEYIATADKLQVGHPPGAPTFQVIGRLFTMLMPNNPAFAINAMSAICSGLSIMFLFWTITLFGKKIAGLKPGEIDIKDSRVWAVFASGIVGSLAYCFSDTFWFSAVEGEVYAMSSFFTAVVFWAVLKWEEQADQPHSLRWLILISFLIGTAIGVHLLNLLAIPAIVYVYYFKRWEKTTVKGFVLSGIISVVLLALILFLIIPYIVNWAGAIEVFFVNSLGFPFNVGTIFYFVVLIGLIVFGIWFTYKKQKPVWNSVILSLLFLPIGYSTFMILVIRSNANTPINENAPKDAVALRAYLGREQYGSTPLFYGQYFTASRPTGVKEGYTKYVKGKDESGKDRYVEASKSIEYEYAPEDCGVFPRMYSQDGRLQHQEYYKRWSGTPGTRKPTMGENLKYFFRYQVHYMYWRYFMWNFVGRQNDIQGHYFNDDGSRDYINGNWISGIKFIDEARLGPQSNMPDHMANNKARNTYYFLPLLLGICGIVFQYLRNKKDWFIVFLLFFMTGLAIVIYLNQPPRQPRERDYAYAGSFYAFAIWIGLGVMALAEWLTKLKLNHKISTIATFVATLLLVPCIMAKENWDDHDRSQKYAARDFANNYLNAVGKNGILITYGDNDTFPLWYTQEVEGTRPDVRILNFTLAGMHWYVEQLYNTLYESENLPFSLPKEFYGLGHDVTYLVPRTSDYLEVSEVLQLVGNNPDMFKQYTQNGEEVLTIPTNRFKITLDKPDLVKRGVITQACADTIPDEIRWEIKEQALYRHELMILDIVGTNKFKREICMLNPDHSIRKVVPFVSQYSEQVGTVFRMLPYSVADKRAVNLDFTYKYFMDGEKSGTMKWGNLNNPDVYVDPVSQNMGVVQRQQWALLAQDFLNQARPTVLYRTPGKPDVTVTDVVDSTMLKKAKDLLALSEKYFPKENFPRDRFTIFFIDIYAQAGDTAMATQYLDDVLEYYSQELKYFAQFKGQKAKGVRHEIESAVQILVALEQIAIERLHDTKRSKQIGDLYKPYLPMLGYAY